MAGTVKNLIPRHSLYVFKILTHWAIVTDKQKVNSCYSGISQLNDEISKDRPTHTFQWGNMFGKHSLIVCIDRRGHILLTHRTENRPEW